MEKEVILQTLLLAQPTTMHFPGTLDCSMSSQDEVNIHEADSSVLLMAYLDGHPNIYLSFFVFASEGNVVFYIVVSWW